MKVIDGEDKSPDEIRHDRAHDASRFHNDCKFCRRDRAQARVDRLVAGGKLVRG